VWNALDRDRLAAADVRFRSDRARRDRRHGAAAMSRTSRKSRWASSRPVADDGLGQTGSASAICFAKRTRRPGCWRGPFVLAGRGHRRVAVAVAELANDRLGRGQLDAATFVGRSGASFTGTRSGTPTSALEA
jgi:hypothetical protein